MQKKQKTKNIFEMDNKKVSFDVSNNGKGSLFYNVAQEEGWYFDITKYPYFREVVKLVCMPEYVLLIADVEKPPQMILTYLQELTLFALSLALGKVTIPNLGINRKFLYDAGKIWCLAGYHILTHLLTEDAIQHLLKTAHQESTLNLFFGHSIILNASMYPHEWEFMVCLAFVGNTKLIKEAYHNGKLSATTVFKLSGLCILPNASVDLLEFLDSQCLDDNFLK